MGKTKEFFKKFGDINGIFHVKMGMIKDRWSKDLTEAEDIKKRWQEYTEALYKKDLYDPDNHDGVITQLEPDIAGSQHEESCPWQGYEEGSLTKRKVVIRFQGLPLVFPKHVLQKPKICWLLYSALLIFSGKSQIMALVFCIWRGCFS